MPRIVITPNHDKPTRLYPLLNRRNPGKLLASTIAAVTGVTLEKIPGHMKPCR